MIKRSIQPTNLIVLSVLFFLSVSLKAQQCRLVIDENFNQYSGSFRNYSESMVRNDFGSIGTPKGLDGRTKVGNGQVRAFFPKDKILGGSTGFTWFDKLENNSTEEAVMEYKMKFSRGFQFTKGGKLPGLTGGTAPRGCNPDKKGGFSARQMWQRNGQMISYLYWPESEFRCGSTWYWKDQNGENLIMDTNKWYTIRQHIKLNRPGSRNGVLEVFVDGALVFRKTDIMFREAGDNFKIDNAYWTTYVGGSTQDFSPTQDQYIWFDDFKVWVNCATPPGTNQAPTVSITSPVDGAEFELGQEIPLSASANDPNGNLDKINFKINDAFYRTDNVRPFETTFTPTEAGTYKIAARAIDLDNANSEVFVTITVKEVNNPPSIVITSPADGAVYQVGEEIVLLAEASDSDGSVSKVNFKVNGSFYRLVPSAPYMSTFQPNEPGTYLIGARAFDDRDSATEKVVSVEVRTITGNDNVVNSSELFVYPNPSESGIFKLSKSTEFEVHTITGSTVLTGNGDAINLSNYPKGLYLLKIDQEVIQLVK